MFAVATNGGTVRGTQHRIRLVKEVLKKVASRRMRLSQSFWPMPTSHEKLVSGLRSGLEKPGKNRSLKVGARKPEPAPPWIRVPVSLIKNDSEPRSVTDLPKTSLLSTRTPAAMKRRSKKRNCCWNSPDTVSVVGPKPLVPCTSAVSHRYSMPNVLVDHVPMWKWLSHSTSRRSTLKSPGKSHTPKVIGGHVNLSGGSTNLRRFQYRPRRISLSHQGTGRVWAPKLMMTVSLVWCVFVSMVGTIGCGLATNSIGTPVLVSFNRTASDTVVLPGSDSPSRVLNQFWFMPSLGVCPLDSKWPTSNA